MSQSIDDIMHELSAPQPDDDYFDYEGDAIRRELGETLRNLEAKDAIEEEEQRKLKLIPRIPRKGRPRYMERKANTSVHLSDFAFQLANEVSAKHNLTKKQVVDDVVEVLLGQLSTVFGVHTLPADVLPCSRMRTKGGGGYISISTTLHRQLDKYCVHFKTTHANMISEACEKALPAYLLIPPLF